MAAKIFQCCVARDDALLCDGAAALKASHEAEGLIFHDCAETEAELDALRAPAGERPGRLHSRRLRSCEVPEACPQQLARECTDLALAQAVLRNAQEEWCQRVIDLRREAKHELAKHDHEWANLAAARRMLKANIGDARKAVRMLVQALELRAQYAQLYRTMRCEARSDMRIVGRDLQGHPVIYMCARSQTEGLATVTEQLVVTFEAACRLAGDMGTVAFVVDMHGLKPHLNMDLKAMKSAADMLGTIYAARICRITLVDFSRATQALWWMVKPLLAPATRDKFAFLSEAQAKEHLRGLLDEGLCERMCRTLEVNRDPLSTEEARAAQAAATTFGPRLS